MSGGYLLLARNIIHSEIFRKPPHYFKLWIWMLSKAFWKDGSMVKRGQLLTTIAEMQDVGLHRSGGRQQGRFTEDQVRSCYQYLKKKGAITTHKTTRGLIITIVNFEKYQTPGSYISSVTAPAAADSMQLPAYSDNKQCASVPGSHIYPDPTLNPTQISPKALVIVSNSDDSIASDPTPESLRTPHDRVISKKISTCASLTAKRFPSGDDQTFIAWWLYAYKRTQGKPYLFSKRDFRQVKELRQSYGLKPLVVMAAWFLTLQDEWLANKKDICMFRSQINRIPSQKDSGHDAQAYRVFGLIPPEGVKFENWRFWEQDTENRGAHHP